MVAWWLVIIGAINWGLVGISGFIDGLYLNVVNLLLGNWPAVESLVYVLVGIAALVAIFGCKKCMSGNCRSVEADINQGSSVNRSM